MAASGFRLSNIPGYWWVIGGGIAGLLFLRKLGGAYTDTGTAYGTSTTTTYPALSLTPSFLSQPRARRRR